MMKATSIGPSWNIGFPDTKLTPMAPAPIPVPYPNLGSDAMHVPFSPNYFVGYKPQLTMASVAPMTLGNQAGAAHPLYMMAGGTTMGNPKVLTNGIPSKSTCNPTWGNLYNNPIGIATGSMDTTTHYADRFAPTSPKLAEENIQELAEAIRGDRDHVLTKQLQPGVALVTIRRFGRDAATRFYNGLRSRSTEIGDRGRSARQPRRRHARRRAMRV